jgi:hypothetical protein
MVQQVTSRVTRLPVEGELPSLGGATGWLSSPRVRLRVRIDGQPPGPAHGIDVGDQGNGTVTESRLYQLIRQPSAITDRQFEIEFLDPGVKVFAFTFG